VTSAILPLLMAACGGGGDVILLGGTVGGLPSGASITLQNNGADDLTLSMNGAFTFTRGLSVGSSYAVTVLTQPNGSLCSVGNASGVIDASGSDVTDVQVDCAPTASIAGTISGLASGTSVTLSNGGIMLAIATNGAFAFPGVLPAGTTYDVVVSTQPAGQSCTVTNGVGTVVTNTQALVVVTCG